MRPSDFRRSAAIIAVAATVSFLAFMVPYARAGDTVEQQVVGEYSTFVRHPTAGRYIAYALVRVALIPGAQRYLLDATGGFDPFFYGDRITISSPPFPDDNLEERPENEGWYLLSNIGGPADQEGEGVASLEARFGSGWSWDIAVTMPSLRGTIKARPGAVALGTGGEVDVRVEVVNESEATFTNVRPVGPLEISGADILVASDGPEPSSIGSLGPGEKGSFRYTLAPMTIGTATITAELEATDETAQTCTSRTVCDPAPIEGFEDEDHGRCIPFSGVAVEVRPCTNALSATILATPGAVERGDRIDVTVTATNESDGELSDVRPAAPLEVTGDAAADILVGPSPGAVAALAPGAEAVFRWTLEATEGGALTIFADVRGEDELGAECVAAAICAAGSGTPSLSWARIAQRVNEDSPKCSVNGGAEVDVAPCTASIVLSRTDPASSPPIKTVRAAKHEDPPETVSGYGQKRGIT